MNIKINIINHYFFHNIYTWKRYSIVMRQSIYGTLSELRSVKIRKSIWYLTWRKGSRRKPRRNFYIAERKLRGGNVEMARPESTRRGNSSSPFVRLSLTILYTWSNSFLVLELENESANSRIRYFVALRTLDWRPSSQPRAEKRFLFPRSLAHFPLMRLSSLRVLRAGGEAAVGAKS